MKTKIKTYALAALLCSSSLTYAEDGITTKISGSFKFESAFRNQNHVPADQRNLSTHKKGMGFFTDAGLTGVASNTIDNFTYGARIALQTSTRRSASASNNGSFLFTESEYGKLELGSGYDAGSIMRVTGLDIARGTADDWTNFMWTNPQIPMVMTPSVSYLDSHFTGNRIETSRKITYFTPKFMDKVQLGISYTPDTNNTGIGLISTDTSITRTATAPDGTNYVEKPGAKDAFSMAAVVTHNITDSVDVKVSLSGEIGKSASKGMMTTPTNQVGYYKLSNLKTYNIGTIVNFGTLSFAGSYMDRGKSFSSLELDGNRRKSKFYTAGTAYNQGPVGVSLVYSLGEASKNTVSSYTLGTDYKLAPGFVPFVEFTYFEGKGKRLPIYNDTTKLKTKGTIALVGARLKF